ncbi:MAG: hypothetical protein JF588_11560 [Caulobacterales bacterium]|nr:hypothetical protein [Caulobacterales bacterium]
MNGSKTYLACALALGYAAFAYFTGHIDAASAGQLVETALIGAGLRHGISTGA